ncbi:SPOR domain-containing protein [Prolixibacter sp. SD074]|uniref:SPOR domain-containing protein n=1 Tax=Prolixibacter sp. SD074 TaxID=2652391 RepID=UPI00188E1DEE|nr:SPOR domain-containing protein [Prolixibacter sp. SD074]
MLILTGFFAWQASASNLSNNLIIIGSFHHKANAVRQKKKMVRKGYPCNIYSYHTFYRVGLGPYASRGQAISKRNELVLEKDIVPKSWVLDLGQFALDATDSDSRSASFSIVVGSFQVYRNAIRLQDRLKQNGELAIVDHTQNGMYHVQVGSYSSLHNAKDEMRNFISEGKIDKYSFIIAIRENRIVVSQNNPLAASGSASSNVDSKPLNSQADFSTKEDITMNSNDVNESASDSMGEKDLYDNSTREVATKKNWSHWESVIKH